ncbi:MAG: SEC-C metal-binding domain-containing protein, partial [Patescibacteria group bacterium]
LITHLMKHATAAMDGREAKVNEGAGTPAAFGEVVKNMMLRAIDTLWVEHLDAMEHLRTGIGLQGYGQRDPLVEYKRESYRMFNQLMQAINHDVVYAIFKISIVRESSSAPSLMERQGLRLSAPSKSAAGQVSTEGESAGEPKVGRNDPCPCGSGKKYKKCGMLNIQEHQNNYAQG